MAEAALHADPKAEATPAQHLLQHQWQCLVTNQLHGCTALPYIALHYNALLGTARWR